MQAANAATYLYQYTGQPFGPAFGGQNTLPGSTNITVEFQMPSLLAASTEYDVGSAPFTTLTMFDGVDLITPGLGTYLSTSFIKTDSAGSIDDWAIVELLGANRTFQLGNVCCTIGDVPVMMTLPTRDASIVTNGFFGIGPEIYFAYNNNAPGDWTVSLVPEPSTWAMMILGFMGIGAMLRLRSVRELRLENWLQP
jgi:hypothetical protein